jgi:hypothetical protein
LNIRTVLKIKNMNGKDPVKEWPRLKDEDESD